MHGRRRWNRRRSDPQSRYYVDRVEGPLAWALVLVAALISLDTFSTLVILQNGGRELNPAMAWLQSWGSEWFVLAKLVPLLVVLPLLASHQFFRIGALGVRLLLYPYAFLAVVHLAMLAQIRV